MINHDDNNAVTAVRHNNLSSSTLTHATDYNHSPFCVCDKIRSFFAVDCITMTTVGLNDTISILFMRCSKK